MGLYIDKLEDFKDYLVIIKCTKAGIELKGLLDDDEVSFSSSAAISTSTAGAVAEDATKGVIQGVGEAMAGKTKGLSRVASNTLGGQLKTLKGTYKGYDGAGDSPIPVSMHFFPNKLGNGSYKQIELMLAKLTQPNAKAGMGTDQIKSYLYEPSDTLGIAKGDDPFKGQLIHLHIGDWFFASGLFCDSVSRSYSKYVDESGAPLFLKVSFSFSPYRTLNAEELAGWVTK